MVLLNFIFNFGGYKFNRMIFGFCMYLCGVLDFIYVVLKNGNLCFCVNFILKIIEYFLDICFLFCFGVGNFKCGGEIYIFVYKMV